MHIYPVLNTSSYKIWLIFINITVFHQQRGATVLPFLKMQAMTSFVKDTLKMVLKYTIS